MHVSVVIPVFNASRFIRDVIESVLPHAEVKEILLVEDGSNDDSLKICNDLAATYLIIRVLRHPGGANRGVAATRNLGMLNAQFPFIAFLDADDVYLTDRFSETAKLFERHHDADGIYETVVTTSFEHTHQALDRRAGKIKAGFSHMIAPRDLFSVLALAKEGYIHLDGLVLRKSSIQESLYFDQMLRQSEDTDFLLRWAASKTLYGGDPDRIVAHRRVHDMNTVFDTIASLHFRYLCMRKCALQNFYGSKDRRAKWEILNRMARATKLISAIKKMHLPVTPFRLACICAFLLRHPRVMQALRK